jgi:YD repeat-containing protein
MYAYGPAGMTSLRAYTTDTASQTTQWNYGFAAGSLKTNDAVSSTWWPDATTGAASAAEAETVAINALGQTVASTDRNGNEHTLSYDVLGRLTDDAVTMLGTDVDGAVRRISLEYDGQGNAYRISSYDSPTGGARCGGDAGVEASDESDAPESPGAVGEETPPETVSPADRPGRELRKSRLNKHSASQFRAIRL